MELLPGRHELAVYYYKKEGNTVYESEGTLPVWFEAQAGHEYAVSYELNLSGKRWLPRIFDRTGNRFVHVFREGDPHYRVARAFTFAPVDGTDRTVLIGVENRLQQSVRISIAGTPAQFGSGIDWHATGIVIDGKRYTMPMRGVSVEQSSSLPAAPIRAGTVAVGADIVSRIVKAKQVEVALKGKEGWLHLKLSGEKLRELKAAFLGENAKTEF
jgi:hypothetical protein